MSPDLRYQVFCLLLLGYNRQSVIAISCRRPKNSLLPLFSSYNELNYICFVEHAGYLYHYHGITTVVSQRSQVNCVIVTR